MPISRKRFSKKRTTKKSVRKNTRKHKKRTPRRKYKKSGKRSRFFGGSGEDERTVLNPNPNPKLNQDEEFEHLYRVQFFKFVNNPETRETDRVPVNIRDISEEEIDVLADYFIHKIHGLTPDHILFYDLGAADFTDPYGYISLDLDEDYNNVVINEGDMDINTIPPTIVHSVTIKRVPNFDA